MGIGVCDRCWKRECECQPPQSPDPRDERIAELEREASDNRERLSELWKERDDAREQAWLSTVAQANTEAELNEALAEVDRLKRVIARELSENDDLGAEYTYVRALKEECDRLQAEVEHLNLTCEEFGETTTYLSKERDRLKEALEGDTLTAKRVNQLLEQRDELQADNARLKTELENAKTLWARSIEQVCEEQTEALRLREALEWYADIANYGEYEIQGKRGPLRTSNVGYDTGERARQALMSTKQEKSDTLTGPVDAGDTSTSCSETAGTEPTCAPSHHNLSNISRDKPTPEQIEAWIAWHNSGGRG